MLPAFGGSVKGLLKISEVCIDNTVFKLHYKVSVIILAVFCLAITTKQYIGEPIKCSKPSDQLSQDMVDAFCWTYSTYTYPSKLNATVGEKVIAPGVGGPETGEEKKFHEYYQWVCIMLFFQAICFYIPRFVWKAWEGGRMRMLVLNLNSPVFTEESKNAGKKLLVNYFASHLHLQNFYAVRFFICEVLNFLNVILQIYLTNRFLDGQFISYGSDVLTYEQSLPTVKDSPMNRVFPKLTSCLFYKAAPNGQITPEFLLCVLSLNVMNEKIYLFLWYWFLILALLTGAALAFQTVAMFSSRFRAGLLRAQSTLCPRDSINSIARKFHYGDWFVLYQLGKNMDTRIYEEFVTDLAKKLSGGQNFGKLKRVYEAS